MARRVFFAFDYRDVFKVNQVRRAGEFVGVAKAGFADASQWEQLKRRDPAVIKGAIDKALVGTSVTVVVVGPRTASRRGSRMSSTRPSLAATAFSVCFFRGSPATRSRLC